MSLKAAYKESLSQLTASEAGAIFTLSLSWRVATDFLLARLVESAGAGPFEPPPVASKALEALRQAKLYDDLQEWFLTHRVDALIARELKPALERCVQENDVPALLRVLVRAIERNAYDFRTLWGDKKVETVLRKRFFARVFDALPLAFTPVLRAYLERTLPNPRAFVGLHHAPQRDNDELAVLVSILERFDTLLFDVVYGMIGSHVATQCARTMTTTTTGAAAVDRVLPAVLAWLKSDVMQTLTTLYERVLGSGLDARRLLRPSLAKFEYHAHRCMASTRAAQMFDIISRYPATAPVLDDIRISIEKTDGRAQFVETVRRLNRRHLLHPGADTRQIVAHYILSIRCMRVIDPQGVLLDLVARPIRLYLRGRDDTIRCIIASFLGEKDSVGGENSSLAKDLAGAAGHGGNTNGAPPPLLSDSQFVAEDYGDLKWVPEPVDAPPDFYKQNNNRASDIVQILVSIYDSKDVFVKELAVLLAQRLLSITDYELARELRNVDVLKSRFGEASMQGCEVMMKDMKDSKRLDAQLRSSSSSSSVMASNPLHATIVSRLFWPAFQRQQLKLPGQLARIQNEYTREYVRLNPNKKLKWLPQLGTINMTVELDDRAVTVDATPLQASVIDLFARQPTWTTLDIAAELLAPETIMAQVRNAVFFWANQGVLRKDNEDDWTLLETRDHGGVAGADGQAQQIIIDDDHDAASAVQSVEARHIEEMRTFWVYIQGMLTNLKSLPLARIHSMLTMLVPAYKGKTTDELAAFLQAMEQEGLVEKVGSDWKIIKQG